MCHSERLDYLPILENISHPEPKERKFIQQLELQPVPVLVFFIKRFC